MYGRPVHAAVQFRLITTNICDSAITITFIVSSSSSKLCHTDRVIYLNNHIIALQCLHLKVMY